MIESWCGEIRFDSIEKSKAHFVPFDFIPTVDWKIRAEWFVYTLHFYTRFALSDLFDPVSTRSISSWIVKSPRDLNYRTRASSPSTSRICSKIYLHLANRGLSDDRTGRYENGQPYQIFNTSRDLWELTSLEQCGNNLKFIRNFVRSASIPFFFSFLLAVSNENS